jgi:hypothetical protein
MTSSAIVPTKRAQLSLLFNFLWISGLFGSLLWSPFLVSDAIDQQKLTKIGLNVQGVVESHGRGRRRNADHFWATIGYEVDSKRLHIQVSGVGASSNRLPLWSSVNVRYLPSNPTFARVDLDEASSSRGPGWVGVFVLWGVTFSSAIGAYVCSRSTSGIRRGIEPPNQSAQQTTSGGL